MNYLESILPIKSMIESVRDFIVEKTHLFHKNIEMIIIDAIHVTRLVKYC